MSSSCTPYFPTNDDIVDEDSCSFSVFGQRRVRRFVRYSEADGCFQRTRKHKSFRPSVPGCAQKENSHALGKTHDYLIFHLRHHANRSVQLGVSKNER